MVVEGMGRGGRTVALQAFNDTRPHAPGPARHDGDLPLEAPRGGGGARALWYGTRARAGELGDEALGAKETGRGCCCCCGAHWYVMLCTRK